MSERHIAVLGAGSWGTALAKLVADRGTLVRLWARRPEQAGAMQLSRSSEYLQGVELPPSLTVTSDLEQALSEAQCVIVAIPTHGLRAVLEQASRLFDPRAPIVSATKGIEMGTLQLVSQIFDDCLAPGLRGQFASVGGPSFAKEVAAGIPTAVCVASRDPVVGEAVQRVLVNDRFRVYTTDDVVGVEIGGALKNVIAIATGIVDGLGFGNNTRAALITRGLAEITRLAVHLGGNPLTLAGLSGMGDLVLTCTGDLSRNRTVGLELGRGRTLNDILAGMSMVAEGVRTTQSAHDLAEREGISMPIVAEVHEILYRGKPALEAVVSLMTRPQRAERG